MKLTCLRILLGFYFCLLGTEGRACVPQVNLGDTISFCQGNSIQLNAFNPNCSYYWSSGATSSSINVTTSGTYWVTVSNSCGITRDTVVVIVDQSVTINFGNDQEVCDGSVYVLQAPYKSTSSYLWQDGSTLSYFSAIQSGKYVVEVTNSCGVFKDSIQLTFVNLPNVQIGPRDTVICHSGPITISAGNPGYPVHWNTGHTVNSFSVGVDGTFAVRSSNVCGTSRDTITVHYSAPPDMPDTIGLCAGGTITLNSGASFGTYLWSNGQTASSISVSNLGSYWVRFTDRCGTYSDTIVVVSALPANVNLGNDTVLCAGTDSLLLNAGYPGSIYKWYKQDSLQNFILFETAQATWISTTGIYLLGINNGCGAQYDTISVEFIKAPYKFVQDTIAMCVGSSVTVDVGLWGPGTIFTWDNGTVGQVAVYNTIGNHSVLISNQCGSYLNNFYVRLANNYNLDLGPNDTICGDSIVLNSKYGQTMTDDVLWSDGSTAMSLSVMATGTYWVKIINECGVFIDSIDIVFLNPPGKLNEQNIQICSGTSTLVSVGWQIGTHYLWSNGDTNFSTNINTAGTFWVRTWNKCDTIYDTLNVTIGQPINLDLGRDTILCTPNVLLLSALGIGADSIRWSTGSKNGVLPVLTSGTYWLDAYNICGVFSDTIVVVLKSKPQEKLKDTSYCIGSSVLLDASQISGNVTYSWQDGSGASNFVASSPGWYWVNITNDCGTIRDSVFVSEDQPLSQINLGNDTVFCQGTVWLDPGYIPGAKYLWSNGVTNQKTVVASSGTYYVKVYNACNWVTDTIEVLITGPPQIVLGGQVKFCNGHSFNLDAQNPGSEYLWNTGDTTKTIVVTSSGVYSVVISNPCGTITDSVEMTVEYPLDDLNLGNDTIICQGSQLILNPGYANVPRKWQSGSTAASYIVYQTGFYWVELNNACGSFRDTIYVEVQGDPIFSLGPDAFICRSDGNLTLFGPPDMQEYNWSNGEQTQNIEIKNAGKYTLEVKNYCFYYSDSIIVIPEDPIIMDLGPDTVVCATDQFVLDPGIVNYNVHWNDQTIQPTKEVNKTGWYWAGASNSCGLVFDSIYVQVDTVIDPIVIDSLICLDDTLIIDLSDYLYDIQWFDGSFEKIRKFSEEGLYPIKIYNKCGIFDRYFEVTVTNCECPVYLANSFTPNGDDLNDAYKVVYDCDIKDYSMEIISRWGIQVFYTEDPTVEWDGTFNGEPMPIGVYSYKVYYKWNVYHLDRHQTRMGVITLVR